MIVEDAMLDLYINLRKSNGENGENNSQLLLQQQAEKTFDSYVKSLEKLKPVKASISSESFNSGYL